MTNCENGQLFKQIALNPLNMPLYAIYQISDSSYLRNRHNVDKVFNLQCFKYRCDGRCNGGNVQVATGELQYHPLSSKLLHKSALLSSERTFSKSTCNHRQSLTESYTFTLCNSNLHMLLMIDLLIQPALQQPSFPHNQHLRLGVPRRVDVLLRRIGGGLVPRSLLLLRCGTWWGLLLVVLVPLLLLPLLVYSHYFEYL